MGNYDNKINAMKPYSLLKDSSLPNTADKIRAAEAEIGGEFPADYFDFLLSHGCSAFRGYAVFRLPSGGAGTKETLNVFFGVNPGGAYDLLSNYDTYKGRMPSWLLPIGEDPFGNQICLAISGLNRGRVYFWDHEEEEEEDLPMDAEAGESNLSLIADSIDAFINSLEFEDNS